MHPNNADDSTFFPHPMQLNDLGLEIITRLSKLSPKQIRRVLDFADKLLDLGRHVDRHSWDAILTGWTSRDGEHWTRPGKSFGVSARVVIADDGSELLTVFSGNAGPLSPDGSYRILSKFNAWALLAFNGDN